MVKTQQGILGANAFPRLLEGDPNVGKDFLGRPTVLRDTELDSSGHFKKYVLRYWHDAQPRNDGRGAPQTSTLISPATAHPMTHPAKALDAAHPTAAGVRENRCSRKPMAPEITAVS